MSEPYVKRKRGMFYSPNNAGYTHHIWAAGFYTLEDAIAEAAHQPGVVTYAPVSAYREDAVLNLEIAKEGLARIDRAIADWNVTSKEPAIADHIHIIERTGILGLSQFERRVPCSRCSWGHPAPKPKTRLFTAACPKCGRSGIGLATYGHGEPCNQLRSLLAAAARYVEGYAENENNHPQARASARDLIRQIKEQI